ncbi:MAG: TlyA family RNA methyltransferase [Salinibacterium sp.]|nr:TlyA family RNA methyltransferase [Salinibacterium sp.]
MAEQDQRLDAALAARGLARSRTHAAKLISDGLVCLDGAPVVKSSAPVGPLQTITVASSDHYVSRAAHKLIAALESFGVDPAGRLVLDVGASTGGFTQVLLERGARHVIALDVGHGQLVASVRMDSRVSAVEGSNARYMTGATLSSESGITETPSLVVGDLSFISLSTVLPALVATVGLDADFVLLIKPQFEVGRTGIREGIVRDAGLRDDAVMGVLWAAWDLTLGTAGVIPSPIAGNSGNHEYLVWLSAKAGSNPTEWTQQVSAMTANRT